MRDATERRIERRNRKEPLTGESLEKFGITAMKLGCSMIVLGIGLPILALVVFLIIGGIGYFFLH